MTDKTMPALRFRGFYDAWEQRKLGEIVEVKSGKDYKQLNKGKIPVYGTGGYMFSVDSALSYHHDAIGIGRKGTIDKPYVLHAPFWTVDTLFYSIPRLDYELDFVNYIFQRINWKQLDESTGVPSLSKSTISNVSVPVSGFDEQKRIGSFFKQLDNLITQNERKIDLLKQLKQAYLQKIFSQKLRFAGFSDAWKECELGEVFDTVTDYVANGSFESLRNNVKSYTTENYAYMIRLQDASNDWKGPWLYTDQAGYLFLSKSKLYSNDIIMSNVGSVGKFFLVPNLDKPMTLAPNAVLIKSSTSNNLFLYQMMIGETMQSKINKKATPGVQSKINKTDFKKITTKIPQKKEQQKIGTLFKQLDNLIALHQQKLNLLKKQKQAFLQKMFI